MSSHGQGAAAVEDGGAEAVAVAGLQLFAQQGHGSCVD
jgi:hypothetical protein